MAGPRDCSRVTGTTTYASGASYRVVRGAVGPRGDPNGGRGLVKRADARRGLTAAVVAAEQLAIADHRLSLNRGLRDAVRELASEQREQAVRVRHGGTDGRWIGTAGDVQLRRNQLIGQLQTRVVRGPHL